MGLPRPAAGTGLTGQEKPELGQDNLNTTMTDKSAKIWKPWKAAKQETLDSTGQPKQDSWDGTTSAGQFGHDSQNRTVRID
jgi:hypothetical protein